MLSGNAFMVTFPRRSDQNYVCCDLDRVAQDVHLSVIDLQWPFTVEVVRYKGSEALPVNVGLQDLLDKLEELYPGFVESGRLRRKDGKLIYGH